ncbi:sulfite reductase [NADPH] hemoprotein beta-component [Aspergillus tubingensis]|uniref:sulfite reductase [NADPH] hemoprotein beta-component n=1 Tax=Aspergillus tubingensis TaxID=5068 RepID=UPI0015779C33|nr:sulfite reductase [NADPH] hemoprotein beta-component [Aspergillus tubingensis]GFN10752.1 sulfite reductase [NADPH] hemoprotein beta-component [Aspergillus tubingensis]
MSIPHPVSDPNLLQEFCLTDDLSRLSIDQGSEPHIRQAKLALLHPLGKANILELCRCPTNAPTHQPCRYTCDRSRSEFLNLHPLGKAWRKELMKIPPFSRLIFDLTLPPHSPNDNTTETPKQWIHWDTSMPQEANLGINAKEVANIVTTIALTTRMRMKGDEVSFGIIYDPTDGAHVRNMKGIQKQLAALGTTTSPEVQDEKVGTSADLHRNNHHTSDSPIYGSGVVFAQNCRSSE